MCCGTSPRRRDLRIGMSWNGPFPGPFPAPGLPAGTPKRLSLSELAPRSFDFRKVVARPDHQRLELADRRMSQTRQHIGHRQRQTGMNGPRQISIALERTQIPGQNPLRNVHDRSFQAVEPKRSVFERKQNKHLPLSGHPAQHASNRAIIGHFPRQGGYRQPRWHPFGA